MKLVCLFLAATISLFSALPVSASASGVALPDNFNSLELLSYGFPSGWDSNFHNVSGGSITVSFDMPSVVLLENIDIVFLSSVAPTSVSVEGLGGEPITLSVETVGGVYYRAFGKVSGIVPRVFRFTVTTSASYIDLKSVRVSGRSSRPIPEVGTVNGSWGLDKTNSATMASTSSPAILRNPYGSSSPADLPFTATFFSRNWVKYDFVDFYFRVDHVASLESIEVSFNEHSVPHEVSTIVGSDSVDRILDYLVHVVVDCRGLDRTGVQFPIVSLTSVGNMKSEVHLLNVTGFLTTSFPSPVLSSFQQLIDNLRHWFSSLQSSIVAGFDRLISVLSPDPKPGEDFGSTVESQAGQLGEAGDILGSVTRPPVQDFDVQIDSFVDPADVTFLGGVVRPFMENKIVLTVLLMSLTLATLGYVLYGKR